MANHDLNAIYFVDPGIGEKGENCPYSNYTDGRDIDMFITPPKGYILTGFKLEPLDTPNNFYNGKIVAQYEKISFLNELKQNLLKYIVALVILAIVSAIAVSFIKHRMVKPDQLPQSKLPEKVVRATPIAVDTTKVADSINPLPNTIAHDSEDNVNGMSTEETVQEEIADKKPIEEVSKTPETQFTPEKLRAEFKKEFWTLIHNQEKRMTSYGRLFREYDGKVSGREYNYLSLTILESTSGFKLWNQKLSQVPTAEIKNVNTISELTRMIEEYE